MKCEGTRDPGHSSVVKAGPTDSPKLPRATSKAIVTRPAIKTRQNVGTADEIANHSSMDSKRPHLVEPLTLT